ncbi:tRNA dimethylallyltransferase [Motilibacter peucedani]|uniref:tRNA dimethylallyltransferase n=1 Tax=Motilibacter peucedani TaxID=598650 RepID=A0A420XRE5_9ACTN|nr:tRNA (adenosine(37)-N6)-dimethylallyltransferase MiaA [Motilibacter peucedani]RKS77434.1 tRNA dimethylallyltransferase [Motilibacter peucedani]
MTVVAVVGPTASGKTALGVELALRLGGEVVNADSMQLYRGMDIGTAKATPEERRGVPHHVLDVWDVTEPADVKRYQELARAAIADVAARGRVPVLVGGSGLYVRAVLDRFEFPATDADLRAHFEMRLAAEGSGALHAELASRDPVAAAAIEPSNARRVVRALEVVELEGSFAAVLPATIDYVRPTVTLGLRPSRVELDERVERRVERMWAAGFVDEVRSLAERSGLRDGVTARRALGYAQLLRALDGEIGLEQARAETVQATRRFVRRQESWFRRDQRITWLDPGRADVLEQSLAVVSAAG